MTEENVRPDGNGRFALDREESPPERRAARERLSTGALARWTRTCGGVITVASEMAFQPMPYFASYAASKAFMLSFSEALAEELRGTGVRVTAVAPGFVHTDFADVAGSRSAQRPFPHLTPARTVAAALRAHDRGQVVKTIRAFYTALSLLARVAPRTVTRRLMGTLMKPDTDVWPKRLAVSELRGPTGNDGKR